MDIKSLICLAMLAMGGSVPMWADDACPEEYATRFPAKNLQTPDYIRLYKALPPALQQELCRKDNTDWKPTTADESEPCPLWHLFLNVLCVGASGTWRVICTPDGNRIVQVGEDGAGALIRRVDVYTRQADGLWDKSNRFTFANRHGEFGTTTVDDEGVTVEFNDGKLGRMVPKHVSFLMPECIIDASGEPTPADRHLDREGYGIIILGKYRMLLWGCIDHFGPGNMYAATFDRRKLTLPDGDGYMRTVDAVLYRRDGSPDGPRLFFGLQEVDIHTGKPLDNPPPVPVDIEVILQASGK